MKKRNKLKFNYLKKEYEAFKKFDIAIIFILLIGLYSLLFNNSQSAFLLVLFAFFLYNYKVYYIQKILFEK